MKKLTVVYDDRCRTCTVGKDFSSLLDRRQAVKFIGINTPQDKELIETYGLDTSNSAYAP